MAFPWWITSCQLRCARGISLHEAQSAFVQATHSIVGGIGPSRNDSAEYGCLVSDKSNCILQCSTVGYADVAGVRVSGEAVGVLDRCSFESNGRSAMISGEAKLLARNTSFVNSTAAAIDPVGGSAEGDDEAKARRCDAVIQGCYVPPGETVWFRGHRPGGLFEAHNSFEPVSLARKDREGHESSAFRTEVVFGGQANDEETGNRWRKTSRPPDDLIEIPLPKGDIQIQPHTQRKNSNPNRFRL